MPIVPFAFFLVLACVTWGCGPDDCPDDPSKREASVCGCGVPDDDVDGDGVLGCLDLCRGFDDRIDTDGDGNPNGCDPDGAACDRDRDCDDGEDCTAETCEDGFCVTTPGGEICPWPAESTLEAVNLTHLGDPANPEQSGLRRNLSGAVWNPVSRTLWVARNGGPEAVWALEEDDSGDLAVAEDGAAVWEGTGEIDFGDMEALTFADFGESGTLFLLDESGSAISEWDLSRPGRAEQRHRWDLTPDMPAPTTFRGPEGLTFVPDRFLAAQGFRDAAGNPATGQFGTGGLFFVGHQLEGLVYVFDLDRSSNDYRFAGTFHTGSDETASLEFDPSTGMLWIFHGGAPRTLEAARLSWTRATDSDRRTFDSVTIYDGPDIPAGGSTNLEGFALTSTTDCVDGVRSAYMTTDDGGDWSLIRYREFPCR